MTPEEIAELERLCGQLGTLEYHDGETSMGTIEMSVPAPHGREFCRVSGDSGQQYANAKAVVTIVNALPKLLAERRERDARLAAFDNLQASNETLMVQVEAERCETARYVEANTHNLECLSRLRLLHEEAEAKLARVREFLARWKTYTLIGQSIRVLQELDEAVSTSVTPQATGRRALDGAAGESSRVTPALGACPTTRGATMETKRIDQYRDVLELWAAWWDGPGRHHYTAPVLPPITATARALECLICRGVDAIEGDGRRCQVCARKIG